MIFNIFMALLGGALYRWRGMASKFKAYFPRPFNQIAFAAPYAWLCVGDFNHNLMALAVLALTTGALLMGHGRFFDYNKPFKLGADLERIEILFAWMNLPVYWHKFLGMCLSGLVVTLPAGLVTLNPVVALSGLLKGPAYAIGYKTPWRTEGGEFITGLFLWGVLSFYI